MFAHQAFQKPRGWSRVRVPAAAVILALCVIALVGIAAPAAAQAPPSPAAAVSVAFDEERGAITVDRAATFRLVVRNDGAAMPAGNEGTASDVTLAVTGIPEGWTASATPASFALQNGQSRTVELQVSVSPSAAAREADLVVTAELVSPLGGLDPILGPGGQSQRATASDQIHLVRDDSVTRDILEGLGKWIYAVLLLLVAAVFVAVAITLSSRRALVRLSSDTRELTVPPGGRVVFPFKVEGLARHEDSALLQVSAVQEGWAAFLPVPELALEPGQVQDLTLVVIAPKNASEGSRQAVLVSATSSKAPKGAANLEFVATVHGGTPPRAAKRKSD